MVYLGLPWIHVAGAYRVIPFMEVRLPSKSAKFYYWFIFCVGLSMALLGLLDWSWLGPSGVVSVCYYAIIAMPLLILHIKVFFLLFLIHVILGLFCYLLFYVLVWASRGWASVILLCCWTRLTKWPLMFVGILLRHCLKYLTLSRTKVSLISILFEDIHSKSMSERLLPHLGVAIELGVCGSVLRSDHPILVSSPGPLDVLSLSLIHIWRCRRRG